MPNKQIPDLTKATVITDNGGVPTQRVGGITEYARWDLIYNYVKDVIISKGTQIGNTIIRCSNENLPYAVKLDGVSTVVKAEYPAFNDYVIANASIMVGTEPYKWKDLGDSWQTPNLAGMLLAPSGVYNEDNTDKGIALGAYKSDAMQQIMGDLKRSLGDLNNNFPGLFNGDSKIGNNIKTTGVFQDNKGTGIIEQRGQASNTSFPGCINKITFDNALACRTDTYTHNRMLGVNYYMVIVNYINYANLSPSSIDLINHSKIINRVMKESYAYYIAEYINDNIIEVQPNNEVDLPIKQQANTFKVINRFGEVIDNPPRITTNNLYIILRISGKIDYESNLRVSLIDSDRVISSQDVLVNGEINNLMISFDYIVDSDVKDLSIKLKNNNGSNLTLSNTYITIKGS